ncbi:MAG TPA: DUF983 domain-containing protein [Acetobacteraceae bacterium]|nr:DUF983 domain-containing protein [Acetobacteraceae bacterium]
MPDTGVPVRWQPDRQPPAVPWPVPPLLTAIGRGIANRCPACGQTQLFRGFLRVAPGCTACGAPLGEIRADDAPPYFVIILTGHIVVPLMVLLEVWRHPPLWLHAAIFLPLTLILALGLLQPVKGGIIGLMLRLGLFRRPAD